MSYTKTATPSQAIIVVIILMLTSSDIFASDRSFRLTEFGNTEKDGCVAMQKMARAVEASGGGTVHLEGNRVSSCALRIANVPVTIEGDGISTCSLTFIDSSDVGIKIVEDDSHKRVVVRGCQLYSNTIPATRQPTAAVSVVFPPNNAPDDSVTIDHVQVNTAGTGYFTYGILCHNCTHHQFHQLDIQGVPFTRKQASDSSNMEACIVLRGFSANGKISDVECTNVLTGIIESGKTEGTKISNINTVAVNRGIMLEDAEQSRDPTSSPFTPGPQIENWHCDAYESCLTSKGWNQTAVHNFNFYKREESTRSWIGIELLDGLYSSRSFPTTHSSFAFGRCAQNGTRGGAICFRLDSSAFANTISNIEPDGMDFFGDEGTTSRSNSITNNHGFLETNIFYPAQRSIYKAWRKNPSPYNFNINNVPALLGADDMSSNQLEIDSASPNVGGFNISIFHTSNRRRTSIRNFENGVIGTTIHILALDDQTWIEESPHIVTKAKATFHMKKGEMQTFVLDAKVWYQQ